MFNNFILASASIGRATILKESGLSFSVDPADIDEGQYSAESAEQLVKTLAYEKAKIVALRHPGSLVVAADTLIVNDENDNEIILGKPTDSVHAIKMLKSLSGKTHRVVTGVCLYKINVDGSIIYRIGSETTHVTFKNLTDQMIQTYINSGEPMGKSGSYGIQGQARAFVESIKGNIDNVVGMPITLLKILQHDFFD